MNNPSPGGKTIAFVGIGVMGEPMIRNLVAAGFAVTGFDRSAEAMARLADAGARSADSLETATEGADVVITMLPDTPHVRDVLIEGGRLDERLAPGSLVIDMSTVSASAIRAMGAALAEKGIDLVDAPVSGGVKGARAGTLSIMAGGSPAAFEKAEPVLRAMGSTVIHAGGPGMGQVFKMCNQLMVASHIQAMCEAFALCRSHGGDLEVLRRTLIGGAAGSWMLENLGPQVIEKDDSAGFRIDLQLKDLRLAGEAAFEQGLPLPGLALATALYLEARAHGEGSNGNQALFRTFDRLTNQTG